MNYGVAYERLMVVARRRATPAGYTERHHIIPRSFGGSNARANIVRLTAREHFVAHRLLAKLRPDSGMVHAAFLMACMDRQHGRYRVTSRTYEVLRIAHAARASANPRLSEVNSRVHSGKKQSPEHLQRRIDSRRANGQPWHTAETASKIAAANKGKPGTMSGPMTSEHRAAHLRGVQKRRANGSYVFSEAHMAAFIKGGEAASRGRPRALTDEQRQRLVEHVNRIVICPSCGERGKLLMMGRRHQKKCPQAIGEGR